MKYSITATLLGLLAFSSVATAWAEAAPQPTQAADKLGNTEPYIKQSSWSATKAQQLGNTMRDNTREQRANGNGSKDLKKLDRKLSQAGYPGMNGDPVNVKINRRLAEPEPTQDKLGNTEPYIKQSSWSATKAQQLGNTMRDNTREQRANGNGSKDLKKLDRKLSQAGYPGMNGDPVDIKH